MTGTSSSLDQAQAYPSLHLTTQTGRLTLLYPLPPDTFLSFAALYNDPSTSTFLPPFRVYQSDPLDETSVYHLLASHVADETRLGFSVHIHNHDNPKPTTERGTVTLLQHPALASPPNSSFAGAFGFTRILTLAPSSSNPAEPGGLGPGLKKGELGLLISPPYQGSGLVSEGLLALLDLGFASPTCFASSAQTSQDEGADAEVGSEPIFGLSLDRIDLSTSIRNAPLRYWLERILLLEPVDDSALTPQQLKDRDEWGEDSLVDYQLMREDWTRALDGQIGESRRDRVVKRVRQRAEREEKARAPADAVPGQS